MMTVEIWILISFLIFVAGVFKPVKKALLNAIDTRIAKVENELREAKHLRLEAEADFDLAKKAFIEFEAQRQEILKLTQERVDRLMEEAIEKSQFLQEKRFEMLRQSIQYQIDQEITKVKTAILKLAIEEIEKEFKGQSIKIDNIKLFALTAGITKQFALHA